MTVRDIWYGLKLSAMNFCRLFFLSLGFGIIAILIFNVNEALVISLFAVFTILLIIQAVLIYFKNSTYKIDENGFVTFPRSDIENSILQIIIFAKYWNLMRSRTVHISEVGNIYINNEDNNINLDVSGTFGSARFEFSTKQKRNEIRNMLSSAKSNRYNINIDNNANINY